MCVRTRIVYACGHYGWGAGDALECNTQKAWKQGIWSAECNIMTSHPLKTYKVTALCAACAKKKGKIDGVVSASKTKIAELKAQMKRLLDVKTKRTQEELEKKAESEEKTDRTFEQDSQSFSDVNDALGRKPNPIEVDLEEVFMVETELWGVLGEVPELDVSSDDEIMSPIRLRSQIIHYVVGEVTDTDRMERLELERSLSEDPYVKNRDDESLAPRIHRPKSI